MAVGSVLPLQHFARALPGRRTLSSCCPSRLSLLPQDGDLRPRCFIGARQRVRGLGAAGLPARAASQPRSRELWGHCCQPGGGSRSPPHQPCALLRVPRAPRAPGPEHRGPFTGHALVAVAVCPRTQPAPWDRHTGTAWHALSCHPCPAASGPTSSTAAMLWSRASQIFASVLVLQLALLQLQC